jgi:TolB-like protein
MPDIFLSYNREDQATARRFAEAFAAEGLEVWWDATLRSGEAYDQVTEKALKTARAVVVLWSPRSVESRWVRAEATLADRNKTLMPAMIEACERPIMFELTQTADLSAWDGSSTDKTWLVFLADVRRFVGDAAAKPAPATPVEAPTASSPAAGLSVCVLPFANMSDDPQQEYFSDGISEDIITDLSKVSALTVISRNSAFTFKGRHVDLPQVARQLNVTHVLEGSVRKAGARVRITAQLIDGATNGHVWADRWDRDLDDIFALQDEISHAIVGALKLTLFPEEKKAIGERGTTNLAAYDLFLRARALTHQLGAFSIDRAVGLFRQALALDSGFLPAWEELRMALALTLVYAPERRPEVLQALEEAVRRAVELAPDDPAIRLSKVNLLVHRRDLLGLHRLIEETRHEASSSPTAGGERLASALRGAELYLNDSSGRIEAAIEDQKVEARRDPLSLVRSLVLQELLNIVGRPDEAQAEYERSKDLAGDHSLAEFHAFLRLWRRGDQAQALAQYDRYLSSQVPGTYAPWYDELKPVLLEPELARAVLRSVFGRPAPGGPSVHMAYLACLAGMYGDADLALEAIRRVFVDVGVPVTRTMWLPELAEARRDPRFKDILRDLGLYDYWRASGNWGDFVRPVGEDDFEVIR